MAEMTLERAKEVFKAWDLNFHDEFTAKEFEEAFQMAFKVLESQEEIIKKFFSKDCEVCKAEQLELYRNVLGEIIKKIDVYIKQSAYVETSNYLKLLKGVIVNLSLTKLGCRIPYVEENNVEYKFPDKLGELCEMYVNGKWITGRIVNGYRFRDGIVTIQTENGKEYWCGTDRTELYRKVENERMNKNE